ncbi:MAG: bifunctional phosphoribosylaminoimidazolecarboxamide formyltransferase/IMP cyclohydrolase [Thermaerobacter sp.]|nr:bifunctional phosphoribosylaminoimidazolecarboxamide formyltransferase/IMP cyclohydrolase [Thermaerobacter sp.]
MEHWALLSVSDKTGLEQLAEWLLEQGIGLLASGGTYRYLREKGMAARPLEDLTGFSEMLGGRVKTLHPRIYGGLLSRETPEDQRDRHVMDAPLIDLVVVNLYPFAARLNTGAGEADLVEEIDIGGVSLIRAAAKNFERMTVLVDPGQYAAFMERPLAEHTRMDRLAWARIGFLHVAHYDALIAGAMSEWSGGPALTDPFVLAGAAWGELRYGENPHQPAAFYARPGGRGFAGAVLHQGKRLSYNNYADADTAWGLVKSFGDPAAVAVKHQNPCGVGLAEELADAYQKAHDADPVSIYGGIVALNQEVDAATATLLTATFLEVVVAPGYTAEALAVFSRKKNLRVLTMPKESGQPLDIRAVDGGFLAQVRDRQGVELEAFRHVGGPAADWSAWRRDADLAWRTVAAVKSNAIVVARNGATAGIGGGQTNRIDAAKQALERAGERTRGAVLASDAYFPFGDVMDEAQRWGIGLVLQPGGSVRDQESIDRANQYGIALYFSGERHFRH